MQALRRRGIQEREEHVKVPEAKIYLAYFQKSKGMAEIAKAKIRSLENKVRDTKRSGCARVCGAFYKL